MSLSTQYTDYRALLASQTAAYDRCSPNLLAVQAGLLENFPGTKPNGCWGQRPVRGGTIASIHSFAALDLSYRGLPAAVGKDIAETCRAFSAELGLQAVHDYQRSRIWRPNRDPNVFPDGWKIQPRDNFGMGWGDWIHIETYGSAWHDARSWNTRFEATAIQLPTRPVVGPSDHVVELVVAVQYFLLVHAKQKITKVDGIWGPETAKAWSNFVVWTNVAHPGAMTTDGNVDGVDWSMIAWLSGGWDGLYEHGFPLGA